MTYDEKVAKAKRELELVIKDRRDAGWSVIFFERLNFETAFPNYECSLYMESRTLLGRSYCSKNEKHSVDIGKCVAIYHAMGIELPDWLRESPVEQPKEKKYKWVFNPYKYLNYCIVNKIIPSESFVKHDYDLESRWPIMFCDKVEVE